MSCVRPWHPTPHRSDSVTSSGPEQPPRSLETRQSYFAHPQALVESAQIGARTRIWAFAHVLPGARIGEECNICDGVFIENDVVVGDRVTVKCGVQLWDGVTLEDDVFIGPNATFTNDAFPRSKQYPPLFDRTIVRRGASIGANATLLPGVDIGAGAMVGAGAVVTANVPPDAIVVGNPARVVGSVTERADRADSPSPGARAALSRVVQLPLITDDRGALSFGQVGDHLPFVPRRYFVILDVPEGKVRGEHAHSVLHSFLVCLHGACTVTVDDGLRRETHRLDAPIKGLYIPPLHWNELRDFTSDTVLLCLSSGEYDRAEYLLDYDTFMKAVAAKQVTRE